MANLSHINESTGQIAAKSRLRPLPTCLSGDGRYGFLESTASEPIGKEVKGIKSHADADSVQASVKGLLANSMTVEDALQIAQLNNSGLQVTYGELEIAEADMLPTDTSRLTRPIAPTGI